MKQLDASIWGSMGFQEKEFVKKKLIQINVWSIITILAVLIFESTFLLFFAIQNPQSYPIETIFFLLYSWEIFPYCLACGYLCATSLIYKEITGKFGSFLACLITGLLFAGFTGWVGGTILKSPLRRRLYRRVEKRFEKQLTSLHANDLFALGDDYLSGKNGKMRSEHLAVICFKKAAELNHPNAYLELGFIEENYGNYWNARGNFQKAFNLGSVKAAYYIAQTFEKGHFLTQSEEETVNWYKIGAEANDPLCQFHLGLAYISGKVVAPDEQLGLQYIEKSASFGLYDALFYLGIQDKEKGDFQKAEINFVKALNRAKNEEEANDAYNELGNIREAIWKSTQKQENFQLALQLFQKAKMGGHTDGNLNYSLLANMLPDSYPSLKILLYKDLLPNYFETVNNDIREMTDINDNIIQTNTKDDS